MSNFGEKKCCIETITHEVGYTLTPAPNGDKLINFYYYLFKIVECTPDCNYKDDPLEDNKTKTGRNIKWTERKNHNIVNCSKPGSVALGFETPEKCKCNESLLFSGLMSDKKFNKWRNFVRKLERTGNPSDIKDILRHQGDRFCEFPFTQIKECCKKKEDFGKM